MFDITQKRKRYDRQFKIAAAKVVLSGVRELSEEPEIKDPVPGRWACEREEMGDAAFPGNESPKINRDREIIKPKKKAGKLERENGILKKFRAFLSRGHARGSGSSNGIGMARSHQEGVRAHEGLEIGSLRIRAQAQAECAGRARSPGGVRRRGLRAASRAMRLSARRRGIAGRAFAVDQKNKLRVGGITRVPTKEGRPCLAAAMDAFSRKAAGWSMPGRITEKITTGATGQAIGREAPKRRKPRLP